MLDYDMLASGNYGRFIYDGDGDEHGFAGPNGSGVIEQVFKDFWDSQGLAYETIPFDGRSDYDAFTAAGVPAGGIFAGAEVPKTAAQVELYGGDGRRALRPVLPPALRHAGEHQRTGSAGAQGRRGARDRDVRPDHVVGAGHGQGVFCRAEVVGLEGRTRVR